MVTPHQQWRHCHKKQLSGMSGLADFVRSRDAKGKESKDHVIKILAGLSSKSGSLTSCRMSETETLVWPTGRDAVARTGTAHRSFLS